MEAADAAWMPASANHGPWNDSPFVKAMMRSRIANPLVQGDEVYLAGFPFGDKASGDRDLMLFPCDSD